ncbi:uncharacterized protein J5M81_002538 isoform 1-T1 [Pluvialis apricaria]
MGAAARRSQVIPWPFAETQEAEEVFQGAQMRKSPFFCRAEVPAGLAGGTGGHSRGRWLRRMQGSSCDLEGLTRFRAENLTARIRRDTAKAKGPRKRCAGQTHSPLSRQAARCLG